jgi:hypothetical protein
LDSSNATHVAVEAEVSEWFDWMRREITQGGIRLPDEETSALFIWKALQLADRTKALYRHLLKDARDTLIKSTIVYQCWEKHAEIQVKAKWPGACSTGDLWLVEATKYIGPIGSSGRHHIVEASDGFPYVVTLSSGLWTETLPATEMICNKLAKLIGLRVPSAAVVTLCPKLLSLVNLARPQWRSHRSGHSPDPCFGVRYIDPSCGAVNSGVEPRIHKRNPQQAIGSLLFDIWTLNLSPRIQFLSHDSATCRSKSICMGSSDCLSGSNWLDFLNSTFESVPAPQPVAAKVRSWGQLESWLKRIADLDMNPVWEMVFQMPPTWYGSRRRHVTHVLSMLRSRGFDIRRAVFHLTRIGYFAGLRHETLFKPPPLSQTAEVARCAE